MMKRKIIIIFIAVLAVLSGCASGGAEKILSETEELLGFPVSDISAFRLVYSQEESEVTAEAGRGSQFFEKLSAVFLCGIEKTDDKISGETDPVTLHILGDGQECILQFLTTELPGKPYSRVYLVAGEDLYRMDNEEAWEQLAFPPGNVQPDPLLCLMLDLTGPIGEAKGIAVSGDPMLIPEVRRRFSWNTLEETENAATLIVKGKILVQQAELIPYEEDAYQAVGRAPFDFYPTNVNNLVTLEVEEVRKGEESLKGEQITVMLPVGRPSEVFGHPMYYTLGIGQEFPQDGASYVFFLKDADRFADRADLSACDLVFGIMKEQDGALEPLLRVDPSARRYYLEQ